MTELVIAVLAMAACIYGTSAGRKLWDRASYLAFRDGLAQTALVPRRLLANAAAFLAGGEVITAAILAASAGLSVAGEPGADVFADAALGCGIALTSVLAAGVAIVVRSGRHAACVCFGARSGAEISGFTLARNAGVLFLLLAGLIGNEFRHGRPSPAAGVVALAAGAVVALLFVRLDDLAELFAPVR